MTFSETTARATRPNLLAATLVVGMLSTAAHAESVLRIGMTAADIPYTAGQPDQGYEGVRFAGITMFDGLTQWDLSKGDQPPKLIPDLATSWEVSPTDNTKWIFKLRPDVKFIDGTPFNADAVVWNLQKILNKDAPNFDPRQSGLTLSRAPSLKGAKKIDDLTVEIDTSEPDSFLPYNLFNVFYVSPTAWKKDLDAVPASVTDTAKRSQTAWNAFASHPVGTGPFKLASFTPRQRLELVKNPDYWDKTRIPKVDRVILLPLPEPSARTAALMSNQVDWVEAPAPDSIPAMKARGYTILANTEPHIWPWQFSVADDSPWKDIRVRQAANLCVDRDGLKALLGGYMTPATGSYEPGDQWYGPKSFKIKYDPDAARKLMTEAGYSKDHPLNAAVLTSSSGSGQMQPIQMNEYMQQNLKQCFIDIKIDTIEWNTLTTAVRQGAKDTSAHGATAINVTWSTMDPFYLVRFVQKKFFPPIGGNWGYFTTPESEKLANEARTTFDPDKRDAYLKQLDSLMTDQAMFLFVGHDVAPRAISKRVHGVVQAQNWMIDLTRVSVK